MTGLDKIIAQIKADTDTTCADIKNKADAQCADIINSAHKESELIKKSAETAAKEKSEDILKRAESSAQLQRRSVLLSVKQEIITDSLNSALEYLCNLPDNEYFELIYDMISKYSEDADGELLLSSKDLARIPSDFSNNISDISKGKLLVSQQTADIKGGFILKYGGIEVNCAFESIFLAEKEVFIDRISQILFPERRSL